MIFYSYTRVYMENLGEAAAERKKVGNTLYVMHIVVQGNSFKKSVADNLKPHTWGGSPTWGRVWDGGALGAALLACPSKPYTYYEVILP